MCIFFVSLTSDKKINIILYTASPLIPSIDLDFLEPSYRTDLTDRPTGLFHGFSILMFMFVFFFS